MQLCNVRLHVYIFVQPLEKVATEVTQRSCEAMASLQQVWHCVERVRAAAVKKDLSPVVDVCLMRASLPAQAFEPHTHCLRAWVGQDLAGRVGWQGAGMHVSVRGTGIEMDGGRIRSTGLGRA